jgi:uncharacterized membrane-anchored protein YjiN (DUF445 family)
MHHQRRLAWTVLGAAAILAIVSFPFRATWWGGWVLAIAEAGIVGGLADWFAVTAVFRYPLGLHIPHTALIHSNWKLMAARVGTMVGDQVLTKDFVTQEIARLDIAHFIAEGAERTTRRTIESVTRDVGHWLTREVSPQAAEQLAGRLQAFLAGYPVAPMLARALETARDYGWDERVIGAVARAVRDALNRPEVRVAATELLDDVLARYRRRMGAYPSFLIGVADVVGLIDRQRLVVSLHAALTRLADDPNDPFRKELADLVRGLPAQLRSDPALAAHVEASKRELLESVAVGDFFRQAAAELRSALIVDLGHPRSETVDWVADRLDAARRTLLDDAKLREELAQWLRAHITELVERYQGRLAGFIEKGVQFLGPEGAVKLIEEHAGDDLQYIRVNGTVVGGLAGGAIYAIHLLMRAF